MLHGREEVCPLSEQEEEADMLAGVELARPHDYLGEGRHISLSEQRHVNFGHTPGDREGHQGIEEEQRS